jgi:hypothetical protein
MKDWASRGIILISLAITCLVQGHQPMISSCQDLYPDLYSPTMTFWNSPHWPPTRILICQGPAVPRSHKSIRQYQKHNRQENSHTAEAQAKKD